MNTKLIIHLMLMSFLFCSINAQNKNDNISSAKDIKVEFSKDEVNLKFTTESYLSNLFIRTGVPGGIVWANNSYSSFKTYEFLPKVLTLKDALDAFTKTEIDYSWNEINGVINIFPQNNYSILETRIPEFKVADYPWEIANKLIETKEFQQHIIDKDLVKTTPNYKNMQGAFIFGISRQLNPKDKVSINLKNATFAEILNETVRLSGYRVWEYYEYAIVEDGKTYHLYQLKS